MMGKYKKSKNPSEIDAWLDTLGYYRKNVAYDETCLFRAISEQVGSNSYIQMFLHCTYQLLSLCRCFILKFSMKKFVGNVLNMQKSILMNLKNLSTTKLNGKNI